MHPIWPINRYMNPENPPILDLEVPLIVQIASRSMLVKEVVALEQGSIIEFPRSADQDLEILINNKSVGSGNAVKVERELRHPDQRDRRPLQLPLITAVIPSERLSSSGRN